MRGFLKKLSRFHKSLQPYIHVAKELRWELKYLKFNRVPKREFPLGVMRVDGRAYHGGLTDRFKGAISWWNYCSKNHLQFKLHYNYPFKLTDYVVPNEYNWEIKEEDIPDSIFNTRIFYARGEKGYRLEKLKTGKNVWYYGNIDLGNNLKYPPYTDDWGKTFRHLFKPSPLLEQHLERCRSEINNDFVAVVFRFQNLLGDFNEPMYRTIKDHEERRSLISKALEELEKIHERHKDKTILVTSDSISFLAEADKKDYTYTIKGNLIHMDFTDNDSDHSQLKSFLDFFMISESSKVYSVVIGDMYKSDFPVYAAKVGGVPFERIELPL